MAIEGPLRELSLPDLLQLVHLSRKTGTLSVRADGYARPAVLHFQDGAVVGARAASEASRLGRLLLMAGQATMSQIDAALEQQRRAPGHRIGAILVETQGISLEDVRTQLGFQVQEAMFELVRWTDGEFRFVETPPLDPGPLKIRIPTETLLLETMRRVDEWSEMVSGTPDATVVPRLVEMGASAGGVLQLLPSEWEVLAAVDGERTLRAIARELGRAEFDVAKAVFSLASSGVVELGKRSRSEAATAPRSESPAGAAAVREVERGRAAAARGEWGAALAALESAVRRDPLLGDAYFELGIAALRTGALERAGDALATASRLAGPDEERRAAAARAASLLAQLRRVLEETK